MGSVNKVILVGRIGAEIDLKFTPTNRAVCNLSVATNEVWKDKSGQKQEKVEWHRVEVWGDQAENAAKYLSKGKQIYLEGKLQTRSYDDKSGVKRYSTTIVAERLVYLGGGSGGGEGSGSKPPRERASSAAGPADPVPPPPGDDDIPF